MIASFSLQSFLSSAFKLVRLRQRVRQRILLNPFFFHHNIHIYISLFLIFFLKFYQDDDMTWISG